MLAILEDAIAVFLRGVSGSAVNRTEVSAARAWLESRDHTTPFGFESICDVLGLDSSYIRRGLRGLRARPAQAGFRFAGRHRGRPPGPATSPPTPAGRRGRDAAPPPIAHRLTARS